MKVLYILRHGKSSVAPPGGSDEARPLSSRGICAAHAMGEEFARRGWKPACALVSAAERTRQTFENFARGYARAGGGGIPATFDRALYLAEAGRVLDEIGLLGRDVPSVLVIGHNPGLHELALRLAGRNEDRLHDRIAAKFPTCALAVVELGIEDWSDTAPRNARLADVVFPGDLD